jgi:hypothetical protein
VFILATAIFTANGQRRGFMQNLKSLNNLLQQPVMGRNDDTNGMVGKPKIMLYDYAEEMRDVLMKIDEPHRKVLSREILTPSKQN